MLPVVGRVKSAVLPALRVRLPRVTLTPVAEFWVMRMALDFPVAKVVPLKRCVLVAPDFPVMFRVPPPRLRAEELALLLMMLIFNVNVDVDIADTDDDADVDIEKCC